MNGELFAIVMIAVTILTIAGVYILGEIAYRKDRPDISWKI